MYSELQKKPMCLADEMWERNNMYNFSVDVFNHRLEKGLEKCFIEGRSECYTRGYKDGYMIGYAEGLEEGKAIGVNKVIVRMLQNKMDIEVISQNTDRSVEYIRKLAKQENIPCFESTGCR